MTFGLITAVFLAALAGMMNRKLSNTSTLISSLGILILGGLVLLRGGSATVAHGIFYLSTLGGWFLIVLGVVATMSSWYRWGYPDHSRTTSIWLPIFLLSMMTVIVAGNSWVFLTAWETMTISSFFLVTTHHEKPGVLQSGYIYLVMSQLSAMFILAGFMAIGSQLHSFDFAIWAAHASTMPDSYKNLVFLLLGLGFGIKSGIVPFHIWLPRAHPVAPAPISALMSGAMIKLGIFGIMQFLLIDLGQSDRFWPLVVLAVGAVSALLGVLYALMEHDLKRLLAYHSIENIGIILLGVGVMGVGIDWQQPALTFLGLAASLFHTLNHAIFKSQLFLAAGAVEKHTGTLDADHLGGLIRTMPGIAIGFLAGSMAITALPPFNGFVSEWLTFRGLLTVASHSVFLMGIYGLGLAMALGLTGALAGVCFIKAFGTIFLGEPRKAVGHTTIPASMTWPVLSLGLLSLVLGIFPQPLLNLLGHVGLQTQAGHTDLGNLLVSVKTLTVAALLLAGTAIFAVFSRVWQIKTVPRWSCGRVPDASMQFTSASFTKAIRTTFAFIYRPHRKLERLGQHAPDFADRLLYQGGTVPVWERHVYKPMYRWIWRVSHLSTRMQAGPIRLYLAYLLGTVGLMIAIIH
ncbi:MAG: proton-conducting transporter membrane subunit [Actinomycetota bacterium]|nr:proton-conducting transporter membrane subunit [Actinomycetota bacterium]